MIVTLKKIEARSDDFEFASRTRPAFRLRRLWRLLMRALPPIGGIGV
jgi:hypothetical protein